MLEPMDGRPLFDLDAWKETRSISLIPDRPDLTTESPCGRTREGREFHTFPIPDDSRLAPVGTICNCGEMVIIRMGTPPTMGRVTPL